VIALACQLQPAAPQIGDAEVERRETCQVHGARHRSRFERLIERRFGCLRLAGATVQEPNIDVATRLAAAVAYGSEQRQRATVKVGGVRRATVDHRSPEPRQRLGEQARVVGLLRGGNRFTRGVFCFAPFTEPNLVLRDHVQELRLFRVVSKRARRDQ
jgi:hypothetical protein